MCVVDGAVADGGLFLVLADDEGGLTCLNRVTRAVLWTRRAHDCGLCAVTTVGEGTTERILSVDRSGRCVVTEPVTGTTERSYPLPGCIPSPPHRHLLEVAGDRHHIVASCLHPYPPAVVAVSDAAAAHGLTINVHDPGGHVVLMDPAGTELSRTTTLRRPLAVGRSTRVAYLRAPNRWVGLQDLLTHDEVTACRHCYERGGYAIAISPDETQVAWSGYEKYGCDEDTREFVRVVGMAPPEDYGWGAISGPAEFTDLTFSPDGRLLLVGDTDSAVSLLALDSEGGPRLLGGVEHHLTALAFADADTVVAVSSAGEVCSWPVPPDLRAR